MRLRKRDLGLYKKSFDGTAPTGYIYNTLGLTKHSGDASPQATHKDFEKMQSKVVTKNDTSSFGHFPFFL